MCAGELGLYAVLVFPAVVYSLLSAFLPVPLFTTSTNIDFISRDVSSETTCLTTCAADSGSVALIGFINLPLLAIALLVIQTPNFMRDFGMYPG